MLYRFILLGFLAPLIYGCTQTSDLSSAPQQSVAQPVSIAYEKYQLKNGLTVILHEDHSDPLVHVDVTYHVGSAREEAGKTGFAHFFEHMMFQGSANVADEQHFKLITDAGGNLNGSTNRDRTNYYETVPANQLEKVLWLESDRMGFLLPAVTQAKFEIQRETVKNERAERIDNQPYARRHERIGEVLYPEGHPYSWLTIGYIEDLDRVNVDDLKAFFKRWYGPNNAVLSIGGDINVQQTKAWIEKYFAELPAGPAVNKQAPAPAKLEESTFITLEDNVHLPLVQIVFPTVYARHEDEAALDVLASILGTGKTSVFYEQLVKTGRVVQAGVSHPCSELACEFNLVALTSPESGLSLASIYQDIQTILNEFEQRPFDEDALERVKGNIKASTIYGLQSVSGKVSTLAYNETFFGQPDLMNEDVKRYSEVTKEDVYRVFNQYIKGKAAVVLSVVPTAQPELAVAAPTVARPERNIPDTNNVAELTTTEIKSAFDRSEVPQAGEPPVVTIPSFWQLKFRNGIQVLGVTNDETPTVTVTLDLDGGMLLDPIDKAGLSVLTAMMMNESTQHYSNEEMANALAKMGSSVSFASSGRYTQVNVSSLTEHFIPTLQLMQEKLFNPAFKEADFKRIKQQMIDNINAQAKEPSAIAERIKSKVLWGSDNRIGLPEGGTVETVSRITLADVKAFYQRYYVPAKGTVVVVGDMTPGQIPGYFDFLNRWEGEDYSLADYGDFPQYPGQQIMLVDVPGTTQSLVRMVKRALPYDATGEYFKAQLMNFPLGDDFNSRINLSLREDKGYTYGAFSAFNGGKTLGWFEASADLKQQFTGAGIAALLDEIRQYREQGITAEELSYMQNAFTLSEALEYETPLDKASFLRRLLAHDLPVNYKKAQKRILLSIDKAEIDGVAERTLTPEELQILVVGDKAAILPQLQSLGIPVVEINAATGLQVTN
ncbi:M16 family metallopeptidase [Alteromonas lipolytica]|uniref:Peptidase M16 n=1 Tax=Alteromonas lipolytica TaxID=1856405 RepID=A0A1E8FJL0_9ALTE|nr:pitrilysin family protein [Alteromonas lipolytica]OFI35936.1 peptidase M16 [Alteromonas lipolytica]GGF72428.1 peptidase M16 [Alteromonas lipolytica]